MRFRVQLCVPVVAIALLFGLAGVAARAQDKQHVVSLGDLNKDAARRPRRANRTKKPFENCFLPMPPKKR